MIYNVEALATIDSFSKQNQQPKFTLLKLQNSMSLKAEKLKSPIPNTAHARLMLLRIDNHCVTSTSRSVLFPFSSFQDLSSNRQVKGARTTAKDVINTGSEVKKKYPTCFSSDLFS